MGLDSCDDVISVLQRDLDSGSLTPTSLISTVNPSGNTINIDKVRAAVIGMNGVLLPLEGVGAGLIGTPSWKGDVAGGQATC